MLDELGSDSSSSLAVHAARVFALAPCPRAEAARLTRAVELGISQQAGAPHAFFAMALAHFRAEDWEPARAALQAAMDHDPLLVGHGSALMAIVEQRLGHAKEAKRSLEIAQRLLQEQQQNAAACSKPSLINPVLLDVQILCREAASLINRPLPP
jgi:Tfp pilus assembly protein PilF